MSFLHAGRTLRATLIGALLVTGTASAQTTWYVDDDADPNGAGTSWQTAFQTLQNALDAAADDDEIRVGGGIYLPSEQIDPNDPRTATFQLINGVGLYGAYAGLANPNNPDERNIELYESVLSGDLEGNDDPNDFPAGPSYADNCYHVFYHPYGLSLDHTAVLDGFTIAGGNASGNYADSYGGAMYCYNSSPTLGNCAINDNSSDKAGGGLYCYDSSPSLTDCTLAGNSANETYSSGGGLACWYGDPVLVGCIITGNSANGTSSSGGGLACRYGDLVLVSCTITGNLAGGGAGISCTTSNVMLDDCTITGNAAAGTAGAVRCQDSTLVLDSCTISGNTAVNAGGVWCSYGNPTIQSCVIGNNSAANDGGGVYCSHCDPTITDCYITDNSASVGGGLLCFQSSPGLRGCTISRNLAQDTGAGVACFESNPMLTNCRITGNSAGSRGGGVACFISSAPSLTNCTIAGNSASNYGGGIYCSDYGSHPTLANCILWNDVPDEVYVLFGSPMLTYCNVEGGTGETWFGDGCIDENPDFVDPDGPDDDPNTWEDNDFTLADENSPCIDAGDNMAVPPDIADMDDDGDVTERTPWDLAGNPRFVDPPPMGGTGVPDPPDYPDIVDMGAYEFQAQSGPRTWYVDDNAPNDPCPGNPNCSDPDEDGSVAHPFDAIQEGIDAAANGDTVLVLDGTYTGESNRNLDFAARAIALRSENGPGNCVIDCEALERGFHFHSGEGSNSIVEGLTITNGYVDSDSLGGGYGGGVYCSNNSDPTLTNCLISDNSAYYCGGGIRCDGSSPTLTNCAISGNSANYGAGVHCNDNSSPTLTNCTISGNSAAWRGGGVYCDDSGPTLTDCTINGNAADYSGGGVGCWNNSDPTLTNCTISENSADDGGGVYCLSYSDPTLTSCAISENSAVGGSGVYCQSDSSPMLVNCAISGNLASIEGGGVLCFANCSPTLSNCTISGNSASRYVGGGVYCLDNSSPILTNCTIGWNSAGDYGGGVYCNNSSPTLANCILWGDTPQEIYVSSGWDPVVTYCDVQGGTGQPWFGTGCIDGYPRFASVDNLHLLPGSPCIDAGDNSAVPADVADLDGDGDVEERTPLDLEGARRFVDDPNTDDTGVADPPDYPNVVDMGAYEFGVFGDLDGDCDVDLADLAELLGQYGEISGMTYEDGDLDGDGDVDLADLAALLGVYGDVCE